MSVLNLNSADKLYYGNTEAQKLYLGDELIFPPRVIDPFLQNVQLLLKFDDNVQDSSGNDVPINFTGVLNTGIKKYGTASFNTQGISGAFFSPQLTLSVPFTIDFWFYTSLGSASTDRWIFNLDSTVSRSDALSYYFTALRFFSEDSISSARPQVNTWIHYAITCDGTTENLFRNGILFATRNTGKQQLINPRCQTGYYDSFRITQAIRYISNFNPETDTFLAY